MFSGESGDWTYRGIRSVTATLETIAQGQSVANDVTGCRSSRSPVMTLQSRSRRGID